MQFGPKKFEENWKVVAQKVIGLDSELINSIEQRVVCEHIIVAA
jgi:hypothetical protein